MTPSFNQGCYLEETIRSVLLQGYPRLEYVVIDGGSKDGTAAILRKYEAHLTHWVSEPDGGQAQAINKGLAVCRGEIFNWLNSDDLLSPNSLPAVALAWNRCPGRVIAGPVVNFTADGRTEVIVPRALSAENFVRWQQARRNGLVWHQPGTFLPLARVKEVGGLREDLHYQMDYLLMIAVLEACGVTYVSEPLARFRLHESSKTVSVGMNRFRLERMEALRRMRHPPAGVSRRELREDHARALVWCAKTEVDERNLGLAVRHLARAMGLSVRAATAEFRHKRLGPALRRRLVDVLRRKGLARRPSLHDRPATTSCGGR